LNAPSIFGAGESRCHCAAPRHRPPKIDDTGARCGKLLGKAKRVLIVVGGGAQDASPEVTLLSEMLQAPVLGYRRGRGVH
jgi:acetolactate synthase-1/2/3 large subunit